VCVCVYIYIYIYIYIYDISSLRVNEISRYLPSNFQFNTGTHFSIYNNKQ